MNNVMIVLGNIYSYPNIFFGSGFSIFGFVLPKVLKKNTNIASVELTEGPLHCITPGAYQLTGVVSYTTCRAGKRAPGPTTRQKELAKTERPLVV